MNSNPELLAVLESHKIDLLVWESLGAASYEHALAASDPALLDQFLRLLFAPGLTLAKICEAAPPWPAGTKHAGRQPSDSLVSEIGKRWRGAAALAKVSDADAFMVKLAERLKASPYARSGPLLESVLDMVGQEVLSNKLDGVPMTEQLAAIDRLLAKRKLDNADRELALAVSRFQRETCELFIKWSADRRAVEIAASQSMPREAQLQELGKLMFGEFFEGIKNAGKEPGRG